MNIHLLPTAIGDANPDLFSKVVLDSYQELRVYVAETPKVFRRFYKALFPEIAQSDLLVLELPPAKDLEGWKLLWEDLEDHQSCGLVSDAGNPCIADPGYQFVRQARKRGWDIHSYLGPNSILLALMSSGLSGQNFHFQGYLPRDHKNLISTLRRLENQSRKQGTTQIFMETPYRNEKMIAALLSSLQPSTILSIACDLQTETQYIRTDTIAKFRRDRTSSLHKRPCIFVMSASK